MSVAAVPTFHVDAAADGLAAARRVYDALGFVVVRNLIPAAEIARVRGNLVALMHARLHSLGVAAAGDELDTAYEQLVALGAEYVWDLIRAIRDAPDFYRLMTAPSLCAALESLLDTPHFQIVHDVCLMRIDPPDEADRLFDWHQDYPYNVLSQAAVTAWIPLTAVTPEMGELQLVPGSQQQIHPINFHSGASGGGKGKGHRVFSLFEPDLTDLEQRKVAMSDIGPGDVAFLHSCVLHRSGHNHSDRARWVFNYRYGNALDPAVVQRGWHAVRDRNPYYFRELHPELVTEVT